MADGGATTQKPEKITTEELARKVICVIDLDADDDIQADAIELYGLSKEHGWLLMMRVEANQHSFTPQSEFYHRVFKVVKRGHSSHEKFSENTVPEA